MNLKKLTPLRILPLLMMVALTVSTASTAFADQPEWKKEKGGKHAEKKERREHDGDRREQGARVDIRIGSYFDNQQRVVVNEYYGKEYRAGHCPPGLKKKHNGCMPPGQAKKWTVGRPLPRDVIYYPVPQSVVVQLGVPPAGHKYVRVASDILLLAVGSSMIVDAIQDLNGL
jgi:Ni/Co efflux regulator RcnB